MKLYSACHLAIAGLILCGMTTSSSGQESVRPAPAQPPADQKTINSTPAPPPRPATAPATPDVQIILNADVVVAKQRFLPDELTSMGTKERQRLMDSLKKDADTNILQLRSRTNLNEFSVVSASIDPDKKPPFEIRVRPRKLDGKLVLDLQVNLKPDPSRNSRSKTLEFGLAVSPNETSIIPLPIQTQPGKRVAVFLQPQLLATSPAAWSNQPDAAPAVEPKRKVAAIATLQMLVLDVDGKIARQVMGKAKTLQEEIEETEVKVEGTKRPRTKTTELRQFVMDAPNAELLVSELRRLDESFRVVSRPQIRTIVGQSANIEVGSTDPTGGSLSIEVTPEQAAGTSLKLDSHVQLKGPQAKTSLNMDVRSSLICASGQSTGIMFGGTESERAFLVLTNMLTLNGMASFPPKSVAQYPRSRPATNVPMVGQIPWIGRQNAPPRKERRVLDLYAFVGTGVVAGSTVDVLLMTAEDDDKDVKLEVIYESAVVFNSPESKLLEEEPTPVALIVDKDRVTELLNAPRRGYLRLSLHQPADGSLPKAGNQSKPATRPIAPQPQYNYVPRPKYVTPIKPVEYRQPLPAQPVRPLPDQPQFRKKPASEVEQVLQEVRQMRQLIQGLRDDINQLRKSVDATKTSDAKPNARSDYEEVPLKPTSLAVDSSKRNESAREKIESQLTRDITIRLEDVTLRDAVAGLAKSGGINIVLDSRALEEEGITVETPVSMQLDGVSLRSALKLLLEPLSLGYVIDDEVLKITSKTRLEGQQLLVAYHVAALLKTNDPEQADFQELIELVTNVVAPDSWQEVGGPGAIQPNVATKALVVRQTQSAHDQISKLLTGLRKWRDGSEKAIKN